MGMASTATTTRSLRVRGHDVLTDSEGYLLNRADWSEDFALALARQEGLMLTPAHWQLIHYLRAYFQEHGVQAQVRVMIKHFSQVWGAELGSNHHLHDMFPIGGPQKQGNRLAGLLRTKGEH
jgi:tRNA 2-thiouridine synthesizing protein E